MSTFLCRAPPKDPAGRVPHHWAALLLSSCRILAPFCVGQPRQNSQGRTTFRSHIIETAMCRCLRCPTRSALALAQWQGIDVIYTRRTRLYLTKEPEAGTAASGSSWVYTRHVWGPAKRSMCVDGTEQEAEKCSSTWLAVQHVLSPVSSQVQCQQKQGPCV
jgi:hypothetical protein